jgi:DNA recombination protein Rad52
MAFTDEQKQLLAQKLDPGKITPPPKGKHGEYIKAYEIIESANNIFGRDGWSYACTDLRETNRDYIDGKWRVGYLAIVEVHAGGAHKRDVGHGQGQVPSLGDAIDSAAKEAVTDGMKRALRTFGNPFGLALYDKSKRQVGLSLTDAEVAEILAKAKTEAVSLNDIDGIEAHWRKHFLDDYRIMQEDHAEKAEKLVKIFSDRKARLQEVG